MVDVGLDRRVGEVVDNYFYIYFVKGNVVGKYDYEIVYNLFLEFNEMILFDIVYMESVVFFYYCVYGICNVVVIWYGIVFEVVYIDIVVDFVF